MPKCSQCGAIEELASRRTICNKCRREIYRKRAAENYKPIRKSPVLDDSIAAVLSRKW